MVRMTSNDVIKSTQLRFKINMLVHVLRIVVLFNLTMSTIKFPRMPTAATEIYAILMYEFGIRTFSIPRFTQLLSEPILEWLNGVCLTLPLLYIIIASAVKQ